MKETYTSLQEFKNDLEKEYSFRDICEINSWIKPEEYQGQMIRCKFHHEKTASMQVGDHFFKCYGCGLNDPPKMVHRSTIPSTC